MNELLVASVWLVYTDSHFAFCQGYGFHLGFDIFAVFQYNSEHSLVYPVPDLLDIHQA